MGWAGRMGPISHNDGCVPTLIWRERSMTRKLETPGLATLNQEHRSERRRRAVFQHWQPAIHSGSTGGSLVNLRADKTSRETTILAKPKRHGIESNEAVNCSEAVKARLRWGEGRRGCGGSRRARKAKKTFIYCSV